MANHFEKNSGNRRVASGDAGTASGHGTHRAAENSHAVVPNEKGAHFAPERARATGADAAVGHLAMDGDRASDIDAAGAHLAADSSRATSAQGIDARRVVSDRAAASGPAAGDNGNAVSRVAESGHAKEGAHAAATNAAGGNPNDPGAAANLASSNPNSPAPGSRATSSASASTSRAPKRKHSAGSIVVTVLATIILLVGVGLFTYPMVDADRAQQEAYQTISQSLQTDADDAPAGATSEGKRAKEGDPAYEYLSAYNDQVRAGTGEAVNDPWGIGSNTSELSSIGLANDIVGSITIDRLNETIPLYLGASRDHLAYGACVIAGTSMPLGGEGNNCAIAAHRGAWHGLTMFRDIEDIQLGDLVVINTPWDTLTYRATEFQVVTPDDTDSVKPQPGRDLVTLLTCHPYGHNYQRYLVICERVEGADAVPTTSATPTAPNKTVIDYVRQATLPSASQDLVVERWVRAIGLLAAMAMAIGLVVYWLRKLVAWIRQRGSRAD